MGKQRTVLAPPIHDRHGGDPMTAPSLPGPAPAPHTRTIHLPLPTCADCRRDCREWQEYRWAMFDRDGEPAGE